MFNVLVPLRSRLVWWTQRLILWCQTACCTMASTHLGCSGVAGVAADSKLAIYTPLSNELSAAVMEGASVVPPHLLGRHYFVHPSCEGQTDAARRRELPWTKGSARGSSGGGFAKNWIWVVEGGDFVFIIFYILSYHHGQNKVNFFILGFGRGGTLTHLFSYKSIFV